MTNFEKIKSIETQKEVKKMKYYIAVTNEQAKLTGYNTEDFINGLLSKYDYVVVCDDSKEAINQLRGLESEYVQRE